MPDAETTRTWTLNISTSPPDQTIHDRLGEDLHTPTLANHPRQAEPIKNSVESNFHAREAVSRPYNAFYRRAPLKLFPEHAVETQTAQPSCTSPPARPTPVANAATQRTRQIREGFINLSGICVYPMSPLHGSSTSSRTSLSTSAAHGAAISLSPTRFPPLSISAERTRVPHDWRRLRLHERQPATPRDRVVNLRHDSNAETHPPSHAVATHAASDRRTLPTG
ncbi:hypothetical protein EDB86DRAFT_3109663 [Lactarius hatsudake]|nr:hypothetical protein EDB86DRAFT_3109663 [Lactarius hatsudake]